RASGRRDMTPYIALELFADDAAEDRIAVEGFDSLGSMSDFLLFAADRLHPTWRAVRADNHDDVRSVLSMLDTIEATARFLIGLGYDDAQTRAHLTREFPGGNVDAAMSDAYDHKRRVDAETQAIEQRANKAAVEAELDLSRSMHE